MKRLAERLIAIMAIGLLAATAATAQDAGDGRYAEQKVVYHVNYDGGEDSAAYRAAMRNLQNHINAVGQQNLEAQVVMHGDGLGLLMDAAEDDRLQTQIGSLKSQGVAFKICANTLEGRDIALDDLYDAWEEDIVPSGVAEISRLQQMGYTYLKP